jgi:LacI family transcriptional regulator
MTWGPAPADAILWANDDLAAGLLHSLDRAGIGVPTDVRVVGFEDVRYANLLSVPLTTTRQPCREIAVAALRAMQDRIADAALPTRSITLSPGLVARESCGAYLGPLKG